VNENGDENGGRFLFSTRYPFSSPFSFTEMDSNWNSRIFQCLERFSCHLPNVWNFRLHPTIASFSTFPPRNPPAKRSPATTNQHHYQNPPSSSLEAILTPKKRL